MKTQAWKTWAPPKDGVGFYEWHDGRCAWCGTARAHKIVTDHCHMTGLVRGMLCGGCNTREGVSWAPEWDAWREGDHPAAAMRYVEVYVGWGGTPISPTSALTFYTRSEMRAWWREVEEAVTSGAAPFPAEAPWSDMATARQGASFARMREALDRFPTFGFTPPTSDEAAL